MFLDFFSSFFFAFPPCDISPIFRSLSSKLYFYFLTAATYFALSCVFYLLSFCKHA